MKTAGRENPKRWATTSQQPSPWRGRSEQISFVQTGCEARKLAATGEIFFLTSPFNQSRGLSLLPPGEDNDAQLFAQTRTLRIRQMDGLEISTDKLDLAALGRGDLTTE